MEQNNMEQNTLEQSAVEQESCVQSDLNTAKKNDKKKSKGIKLGIIALVAVILGVGVFTAPKLVKAFRKLTMSPAEYYQYVETKNRDNGEKMIFEYYDAVRKSVTGDSYAKNVNMKAELSDTAKSLLSTLGTDFSKLQNLEIDVVTGKEGTGLSNQVKLRGNDQDLVTLKTYMDEKNKEYYYQIPELNEAYLDMSAMFEALEIQSEEAAELDEIEDNSEVTENSEIIGDDEIIGSSEGTSTTMVGRLGSSLDYNKLFMETETLKELYNRYTDILIKSAKNVKKSEGGCKAEGVSQEADKYTVTLDPEEISKLLKDILTELKEDKSIQKFLEELDESAYEEFTTSVDEALEYLESGDDTEEGALTAVQEVQISSDERIIGRNIILQADGENKLEISYALPQEEEKFGCEFTITTEDGTELLKISGSGTLEAGVLNGNLTLGLDNSILGDEVPATAISFEKLLKMEFKDYDMSKISKGKIKGKVIYSSEAFAELANYSFEVETEGDMEESTGKITVFAGKEEFLIIHVVAKSDVSLEGIKPSADAVIYDMTNEEDILRYDSEIDAEKLLTDIQEKLGVDLTGLMTNLMMSSMPESVELPEDDISYYDVEEYDMDNEMVYSEELEDSFNYMDEFE